MKLKLLATILGITALLALGVACTSGTPPQANTGTNASPSQGSPGAVSVPPPSSGLPSGALSPLVPSQFSGYVSPQTYPQQTGIWVSGLGTVTVKPDLALLYLGVESRAKTVEEARSKAASAMDAIINALKRHNIPDKDIQTKYFNIRPEYQYTEVIEGGVRTGKQVLVGYIVTNNVTTKIRDLDTIGTVIDDVASAGGDLTRIDNISFTVENTTLIMNQAREMAVRDAVAKARQFADLTGVTLGKLVFISEAGATPIVKDFSGRAALELAPAAAPTPITPGELDVQLIVQAVFHIQ